MQNVGMRVPYLQKETCLLEFGFTVGYLLNSFLGRFWHAKMETLSKLLKAHAAACLARLAGKLLPFKDVHSVTKYGSSLERFLSN